MIKYCAALNLMFWGIMRNIHNIIIEIQIWQWISNMNIILEGKSKEGIEKEKRYRWTCNKMSAVVISFNTIRTVNVLGLVILCCVCGKLSCHWRIFIASLALHTECHSTVFPRCDNHKCLWKPKSPSVENHWFKGK